MALDPNEARRSLGEGEFPGDDDLRGCTPARELDGMSESQRDEWRAMRDENEDLRHRLREVEIPSGLLDRVRGVREGSQGTRRRRITPLTGALAGVAVILVTATMLFFVQSAGSAATDARVYDLAVLAAMDHSARPELSVRAGDLDALQAGLSGDAPFMLNVSSPEPGAVLVGGRVCSFGDRPLMYTCWRDGENDVAVYQVRRSEFDLPGGIPATEMFIPQHGSPVSRCRVTVWSDGEFAYVVVHDQRRSGD